MFALNKPRNLILIPSELSQINKNYLIFRRDTTVNREIENRITEPVIPTRKYIVYIPVHQFFLLIKFAGAQRISKRRNLILLVVAIVMNSRVT